MSFKFQEFIIKLRENEQKKEVVEKYERYVEERIAGDIQDQFWYKDYVSKFNDHKPPIYMVPEKLKNDFDWDMLCILVASSFSSEGNLIFKAQEDKPHFLIHVKSGDQVVKKLVANLAGFQIVRLFEIYIEEQMNLSILIKKDDEEKENEKDKNEKNAILAQRDDRLRRWEYQHKSIPIKKKVNEFENKILSYLEDIP